MRFPPEEQMKYSEHLDWHFHENRRKKKPQSKGWYMSLDDWKQYVDSEDSKEGGMIYNSYLDMTFMTV
jgi:hypothetical protein